MSEPEGRLPPLPDRESDAVDRAASAAPAAGGAVPAVARPLARREVRIAGTRHAIAPFAATIGVGLAGALVAREIGTPLPWMFGALVATATSAIAGLRVAGLPLTFPQGMRFLLVPLVGVAIGGQVSPDLIDRLPGWWITLAALALFLPVIHLLGYLVYARLAGYDRVTALYAAMPGGLIEAVSMGEAAGGHGATLTLLQFARLILCILMVPLAITAYEGHVVGSAAGLDIGTDLAGLTLADAVLLGGAAVVGYFGARRIGMPAAVITGPILVSAAIHLAGLTEAHPPGFLIALTQLVVGTALGTRFVGIARGAALKGLGWAALTVGLALLTALLAGLALTGATAEGVEAVILAFAPGGVTEMALVALSLELSVVFVTAHHVARILYIVFYVRPVHAWLRRHRGWP
ncbi:MAG: AbrB family transcriptional regulator [Pseudomonadota bacterium]